MQIKRFVLLLPALILIISGCQAVIDFAPISPLPAPLPVELPMYYDAYQIVGNTRAVNVTCSDGRPVVILEQRPNHVQVGCIGDVPTATPTITATVVASPTATVIATVALPTVTPTPTITPTATITATVTPTATEELPMTTFTSQPDATAGIDTFVYEGSADAASGTNVNLTTHSLAAARRLALLEFDVSSLAGATVNSAILYLYNSSAVATTYTFELNSLLAANSGWVEGATWNYANPSTVRWAGDAAANGGTDAGCSVSGTDWNATALGTFTYTANNAADTEHAITLTVAQVQAWVDGSNYGLVVRRTDALAGTFNFRSSDYVTDATKRPKLVIEYTAAGGDVAARTIEIGGQFGVTMLPTGGAGLVVLN